MGRFCIHLFSSHLPAKTWRWGHFNLLLSPSFLQLYIRFENKQKKSRVHYTIHLPTWRWEEFLLSFHLNERHVKPFPSPLHPTGKSFPFKTARGSWGDVCLLPSHFCPSWLLFWCPVIREVRNSSQSLTILYPLQVPLPTALLLHWHRSFIKQHHIARNEGCLNGDLPWSAFFIF